MRKLTVALSAAALTFSGAALAQAGHQGHRMPMGDMTRAQAQERAAEMFTKMDANRDGTLNQADRAARHAAMFARLDADKDGAISKAELEARHREHGGKWRDKAARPGKPALTDAQKAERRDRMFARLDTDGNGTVSRAEFDAVHAARMARGGKRGPAKRMATKDGTITRQAFVENALARFDRADADRDGTVTTAERKAMRETMRQQWQARKAERRQG